MLEIVQDNILRLSFCTVQLLPPKCFRTSRMQDNLLSTFVNRGGNHCQKSTRLLFKSDFRVECFPKTYRFML